MVGNGFFTLEEFAYHPYPQTGFQLTVRFMNKSGISQNVFHKLIRTATAMKKGAE
jgi:hypothetical protein